MKFDKRKTEMWILSEAMKVDPTLFDKLDRVVKAPEVDGMNARDEIAERFEELPADYLIDIFRRYVEPR